MLWDAELYRTRVQFDTSTEWRTQQQLLGTPDRIRSIDRKRARVHRAKDVLQRNNSSHGCIVFGEMDPE